MNSNIYVAEYDMHRAVAQRGCAAARQREANSLHQPRRATAAGALRHAGQVLATWRVR